jgi:hypothetical protein
MANLQDTNQPVAWMDIDEKGAASGLRYWSEPDNRHEVALYSAPQPEQEQGEPVGVAHLMQEGFTHCIWSEYVVPVGTKLYTTPQQRTWVGSGDLEDSNSYLVPSVQRKPLTDEQIEQMWERTGDYDSFARAIEAAHGIKE